MKSTFWFITIVCSLMLITGLMLIIWYQDKDVLFFIMGIYALVHASISFLICLRTLGDDWFEEIF